MSVRQLNSVCGRAKASGRRGFTLLETSMAMVIIGVGVLAFVDAQKAFVTNNNWSSHAATGAYLANEVREFARRLPRHDPVTGLYLGGSGGVTLYGWGLEPGASAVADFNDLDDLDTLQFGNGGVFAGPINGFGEVIQSVDLDGNIIDGTDIAGSMNGWCQTIYVQKVDPVNFGLVRANNFSTQASGVIPARNVDQFPLRVTVVVTYQGPTDPSPNEVTRMYWVVPP
ncbi:MAG: prepilin-type N-terminal cleavage/methylation domain-containing protein [Planctomycetota bacterium]